MLYMRAESAVIEAVNYKDVKYVAKDWNFNRKYSFLNFIYILCLNCLY